MSDALKNSIVLSAILFGLNNPCLAAKAPDVDGAAERASLLCKDGQVEQAIDLQTQILKKRPGNWLAHATMSYLRWQTGDVVQALAEGEIAARLAPRNAQVWLNLGHMHQAIDEFEKARVAYEKAVQLLPEDWAPRVCLAKAYMRSERPQDALRILSEMIDKKDQSYKWYHETGECLLAFNEPSMAEQAANIALSVAVTPQEKEEGSLQLFTALLRRDQFDKADKLKDFVFSGCQSRDFELYVRAANGLYSAKDFVAIKSLLDAAHAYLQAPEDAEGFFRLGRICQDKSVYVASNSTEYGAWLKAAKACYSRAVELSPQQARYHLALAGVASALGQTDTVQTALANAKAADSFDPLATFLLNRPQFESTNLTMVRFQMDGLTCGCQLTHFHVGLGKIGGVAFVDTAHEQPYRGTMLIDLSKSSAEDAFARCLTNIQSTRPDLKMPDVKFTALSSQPLSRVDDVIRIALNHKCGDVLRFDGQFRPTVPDMPVALIADTQGKLH